MTVPVAVFASGSGTNLQALLDGEGDAGGGSPSPYRVELVVADRSDAGALDRARKAGRRTEIVPVSDRPADEAGEEIFELLREEGIGAVLLAGYLRLIPSSVVRAYRRRILNIHPALLPSFGGRGMYGIRIHRAVLESGAKITGVTVHYVDEEYDTGTIFAQWPVPVRAGDTPEALASRVLRVEHLLYPLAAAHLCRALSRGEEPAPFDPPGDAYLPCGERSEDIRRSLQTALR